jgi:cob(I)alamin adenosyltransferase
MTNRLSHISTRKGDDGTTGLADGTRLAKDHLRIEALGCIDELNSLIGLTIAQSAPSPPPPELAAAQHKLFELGAELAVPGAERVQSGDVERLEAALKHHNAGLPPLKEFILPGGNLAAAHCHLARTVCRRAERRLVQLGHQEKINPQALRWLNRLSDLLFVLARVLARRDGGQEVYWQPQSAP